MNELRWLTIELILDQVENKQNLRYHLGQFSILYTFCLSKRQDAVVLDEIWSNSEARNGFKYFLSIIISMGRGSFPHQVKIAAIQSYI